MLGAPPAELQPGEKAALQNGSREELNARMQQMEVTIQSLNAQIEALDKELALTTDAIALQQKLQAAQAAQAAASVVPAPVAKPAEAPPASNSNTWREVLLSALAGGVIAAGIAHILGRRRDRQVDDHLPLAASEQPRNEPAVAPPPSSPLRAAPAQA